MQNSREHSRAKIVVYGGVPEAVIARHVLSELGGNVIELSDFERDPRAAYGLFFVDGPFKREGHRGDSRPCDGLLRVRTDAEELRRVGITTMPQILAPALGFIVCRRLTTSELNDKEMRVRFTDALRQGERVCTRRWRALTQPKGAPLRAAPKRLLKVGGMERSFC
ncbi:MAG TPA: hypothetical protein VEA36_03405 [Candidatus Paceibacterota bacterium]|nr:hypothetical protein [Candidatus Paceibacterota bacterium]